MRLPVSPQWRAWWWSRAQPPGRSEVGSIDELQAGGAFLEAAGRFGYDSWGIEPSWFLVSKGKQRGLQIEQGLIENHSFAPASFDMVILWDVIEHLLDPLDALCRIRSLLKSGGALLLNFRDIDTWQARSPASMLLICVAAYIFTPCCAPPCIQAR